MNYLRGAGAVSYTHLGVVVGVVEVVSCPTTDGVTVGVPLGGGPKIVATMVWVETMFVTVAQEVEVATVSVTVKTIGAA